MDKYGYSLNNEEYYDLDYIMDRVNDDYPKGQEVEVFKGERVEFTHKDFINSFVLFDNMEENAYEKADEYANSYKVRPEKEKAEELNKIIADWCDKNIKKPDFWTVKNIVKIKLISE